MFGRKSRRRIASLECTVSLLERDTRELHNRAYELGRVVQDIMTFNRLAYTTPGKPTMYQRPVDA